MWFVLGAVLLTTVAVTSFSSEKEAGADGPPHGKPNLLFITLDTLRADHLGCYGYSRPTSPVLDAFAAGATLFSDVTCNMPTTLPSHLTIFSGLTPAQHGVTENGIISPRPIPTVFSLLGGEGFSSAAVVSGAVLRYRFVRCLGLGTHVFGDGKPTNLKQVSADVVNLSASQLLANTRQPFALWLHYFDTHGPYTPSAEFRSRFVKPDAGSAGGSELVTRLNKEPGFAASLSDSDLQHIVDLYDAEIAYLDSRLGELFDHIRELGLWDDLLIVVVGDHGEAFGEFGFWGHGGRLDESIIKVPLLVKLPGQKKGRRIQAAVETIDILPTLTDFYGLQLPTAAGGRSLLPALNGGSIPSATQRLIERRTFRKKPALRGWALLGSDWKLVRYVEEDGVKNHLGRSSGERGLDGENFYGEGCDEEKRLESLLESDNDETPPLGVDEGAEEMLRALGYVD